MNFGGSHVFRFIQGLLAPPGEICLTCGSRSKLLREWPGICHRCAGTIPWINRPRCLCCGRSLGCQDCLREEARHRAFVCNRSAVQYNSMMREWLAQYKYRGHERYAPLLIHMLSRAYEMMEQELGAVLSVSSGSTTGTRPGVRTGSRSKSRSKSSTKSRSKDALRQVLWKPDVITYVPVSRVRLAERGFNQAEVLAKGLGRRHQIPVLPLLIRSEHTAKQSFKSRQERIDSMRHAFDIHDEALFASSSLWKQAGRAGQSSTAAGSAYDSVQILLIDDIYTTGSTIDACAGVLKHAYEEQFNLSSDVCSLTWARS